MADLTLLSIAELSKGFNNKEFSSTEVTKAYIENMEKGYVLWYNIIIGTAVR